MRLFSSSLPPVIVLLAASLAPLAAGAEVTAVSIAKLDPTQSFEAGQVAGLFGGGLSLSTAGADRVLVVANSSEADDARAARVPVTLFGEVVLKVVGPTRAGDLLFASGRNDGTAAGLDADEISPARLPYLVGRALEANPVNGTREVRALVGLAEWEAVAEMLEVRDALLEAQELELEALRAAVADLEGVAEELEAVRLATAALQALEEARRAEELAPLPLDP